MSNGLDSVFVQWARRCSRWRRAGGGGGRAPSARACGAAVASGCAARAGLMRSRGRGPPDSYAVSSARACSRTIHTRPTPTPGPDLPSAPVPGPRGRPAMPPRDVGVLGLYLYFPRYVVSRPGPPRPPPPPRRAPRGARRTPRRTRQPRADGAHASPSPPHGPRPARCRSLSWRPPTACPASTRPAWASWSWGSAATARTVRGGGASREARARSPQAGHRRASHTASRPPGPRSDRRTVLVAAVVSMGATAALRLMEAYGVAPRDVGK
jgi:hypothetical protein